MDKELYKELGIDEKAGLKDILSELESRQFDCLERLDSVSDDERRQALELTLSKIDKEIADIKDQIKNLKSGIIFEDDAPSEGAKDIKKDKDPAKDSKKEAEKKKEESAKKKEDVSKKVENIKQKEADRKQKEEEKQQKAAEAAAKAAQASVGLNVGTDNTQSNVDPNPELTKALLDYKKGDFVAAFEGFRKLSEADNETAQYMFSNMYRRGEGTPNNNERAEYWMKRSADNGYTSAQLDYGIILLADGGNCADMVKAVQGLSYVGRAADSGDKQAILKYIEGAKKQIGGRQAYEKAMAYCDKLKSQSTDSYDNEQYDTAKQELNSLRKDALKIERKTKRANVFTIIGSILIVISALYIFIGAHSLYVHSHAFLKLVPRAFDFLVNDMLCYLLASLVDGKGVFGFEMLAIGCMFLRAGNSPLREKKASLIEKIAYAGCIAFAGWHFYAQVQEGVSFYTQLGWFLFVIAAAVIVGNALGFIVGLIFKTQ
jgi:TPR repeat protein